MFSEIFLLHVRDLLLIGLLTSLGLPVSWFFNLYTRPSYINKKWMKFIFKIPLERGKRLKKICCTILFFCFQCIEVFLHLVTMAKLNCFLFASNMADILFQSNNTNKFMSRPVLMPPFSFI